MGLYRLYLSLRKKFRKWEVKNINKFLNKKTNNIVKFDRGVNITDIEKIDFGNSERVYIKGAN